MLKLQCFGHLIQTADSLENTDAEKGCWQKEKVTGDEMVYGITNAIYMIMGKI